MAESINMHYPFGITEETTDEKIITILCNTFNATYDKSSDYFSFDEQVFYGFPITHMKYASSSKTISITLDNEQMNAQDLNTLYSYICNEYGDPIIYDVYESIITLSGKEKKQISIDEINRLQNAYDHFRLSGLICWDNVSLEFSAFNLNLSDIKSLSKSITIDIALTEDTVSFKVKNYYQQH